MLQGNEKEGAARLLSLMNTDELLSLLKTVTNDQISACTKQETIRAIITYSASAAELFRRRKLKRNILFQYLAREGIAIDPKAEKMVLARKILLQWGTSDVDSLDLMEIDESSTGGRIPALMPPYGQTSISMQTSTAGFQISVSHVSQPQHSVMSNSVNVNNQQVQSQGIPQMNPVPSGSSGSGQSWLSDFMNFEYGVQSLPEDQEMGLEFCRWFYRMLNSCNPQGQPFDTPFSEQHFIADTTLKVLITNTRELQEFHGSTAVCEKLLSLVKDEQMIFNANVEVGGVKGLSTAHGLKILLVCGTLHRGGDMIGIFAQQFGLVRNPQQNFNWSIKYSNLKLIAGKPSQLPTLDNPGNMLPLQ